MNVKYMNSSKISHYLDETQENRIVFVTGNKDKFKEVEDFISQLNPSITLEQADIDLPEYQGLDIAKIALAKAECAWSLLKRPVLIDDGGIYLERFNNFPGPLVKYVFEGIGLEGFWLLAKDDPRAYFLSYLVYYHAPNSYEVFQGTCYGTIIEPTGIITRLRMPFRDIFVPQGSSKNLTELHGTQEELFFHHRFKALSHFVEWLSAESKRKQSNILC